MPEDPGSLEEVARDVVAKVAPHELGAFPAISRAYFAANAKARSREDHLGFGWGDAEQLVSLLVLGVLTELTTDLTRSGARRARAFLGRSRKRRVKAADPAPAITTEAAADALRQRVLEAGREQGMTDDEANALADELIARLS